MHKLLLRALQLMHFIPFLGQMTFHYGMLLLHHTKLTLHLLFLFLRLLKPDSDHPMKLLVLIQIFFLLVELVCYMLQLVLKHGDLFHTGVRL